MRYPRIYDLNLRRTGELRTAEITDLKLKDTPLSCVTVTVPTKDIGSFGYRQFVEIFDAAGKRIDLFRVTEIPKGVYGRAGTKKLKCVQVLCTLSDDITPTYMQIGGNGQPLESCIRQVLACQQTARWKLGRCDFATLYEYSFASEGLLSALLKLIEPIPDALMTTDTTSYPWTLNVVRADDTDATELRYSRNMEEISEEVLDTDFATRLYPLGYGEGVNQLNIKSVNGGTAYIDSPTQALWGVVSKPYVDTTITDAATLLAQGRAALELCCNPHVSYGVTCKDISILTGEPLDAFYTGRMARIIYRDYGLTIRARVREIHYPKPITEPWNAKLTIANRSADVASVIAQLQRTSRIEQLYGQGSTTFYSGGIEQNADKDTPAEGDIYLPETMVHVNAVMLKVTLSAFRADSKGAAAGGGKVQTTQMGGGSTQTSEAGGYTTVTVRSRTVSAGVKYSGGPVDDEGGSNAKTGLPTDLLGNRLLQTDSFAGSTSEAGGDIGVSAPVRNGVTMAQTDAGGVTRTGSTSGNTGTPLNVGNNAAMTETGTGGPMTTGSSSPGTNEAGSDQSTSGAQRNGAAMSTTDNASPGTDSQGSHSHTVNSHSHTYSFSIGIAHNHKLSTGASATGGIYSGVTKVSADKSTGTRSPGTDSQGSHSHTVNAHNHNMAHYHTLSTKHSHTVNSHNHSVEQHRHGMNHYHNIGSHSHSMEQHTHGMSHTHTLSTRHSHTFSHAHGFDHVHNMQHVHSIAHEHVIPQQTLTIEAHRHTVSIPSHSHVIELPEHEHEITYGMFKGPSVSGYVVEVDGKAIPGSVFDAQGTGDIAPYLSVDDSGKIRRGTFHTLAVRPVQTDENPDGLCHIRASWNVQVFISCQTGVQY